MRKVSSSSAICDVKPDLINKKICRKMPEKCVVFGCKNVQKSDSTASDTCYVKGKKGKSENEKQKIEKLVRFCHWDATKRFTIMTHPRYNAPDMTPPNYKT